LGNNDGEVDGLESFFSNLPEGSELHGRFADIEFDDTRFAVLHGEDRNEVREYARSGDYDYVLYGHYHTKEEKEVDGTTVINPGAHFPTVPDEHRTVALIDTEQDEDPVEFVNLVE
ncbi:MAG: metallophosphoesterase family protein, partial [Halobacteria archaeon]|nr:metallophosphoesterase family protein [Halobacteria archaeon]